MTTRHDTRSLGAYVLSALDQQEMRAMERHLASCAPCRAEVAQLQSAHAALGGLPPEAWLDGPPEGGDLLLQRTLRTIRRERNVQTRNRRIITTMAAAAAAVVLAGGGIAAGRFTAPTTNAAGPEPHTISATNPATGAAMSVSVQPAAGWVRLSADVKGIPQGEKCRIYVVSRKGNREEAGSWLVSSAAEQKGTHLDGTALVAPGDVARVEVENFDGKQYVGVNVS
ncbi:anti-sigma factor family protein [Amycolatopsis pigmentata]|uniref:Anti-sigma factor family protein n=1 Tax=Amycolatopsis pigmentata TaxID=450801 RepID=A0ABW5FVD0_9PSEU